jgi:hypothetical protein
MSDYQHLSYKERFIVRASRGDGVPRLSRGEIAKILKMREAQVEAVLAALRAGFDQIDDSGRGAPRA